LDIIRLKFIGIHAPRLDGFTITPNFVRDYLAENRTTVYESICDLESGTDTLTELKLYKSTDQHIIAVAEHSSVYGRAVMYKMLIKAIYNLPPIKSKEYLLSLLTPTISNVEQVLSLLGMCKTTINLFRTNAAACNQTLLEATASTIEDKTFNLMLQYDAIVNKLTICNNMIWEDGIDHVEPVTAAEWYGDFYADPKIDKSTNKSTSEVPYTSSLEDEANAMFDFPTDDPYYAASRGWW
jgi:hypothetical protein